MLIKNQKRSFRRLVSPGTPGATVKYTYQYEGQSPGTTYIEMTMRSTEDGVPYERKYYRAEVRENLTSRIILIEDNGHHGII